MKKSIAVILIGITLLLTGCGAENEEPLMMDEGWELSDEQEIPEYDEDFELDETPGGEMLANNNAPALENRKIIYKASLAMVSTDPEALYQTVVSKFSEYDAYFETEDINDVKYTLKIRVLSSNLMDFINDIKGEGEVISYSKTSEDITNTYSRFEAEYAALETEYDRIYELLQLAYDLDDIYSLSNRLSELEADLNEIALHLSSYDSLVDYSTINLVITRIENIEALMDVSETPGIIREEMTETEIQVRVYNNSMNRSEFYIVLKENGEEVTTLTKNLISESKELVVFSDLKPDTEYKIELYSTEDNHLRSRANEYYFTTDKTFGSTLTSTFTTSFDSLVWVLQGLLIIVFALVPYAVVFTAIGVPAFILYKKRVRKTKEA